MSEITMERRLDVIREDIKDQMEEVRKEAYDAGYRFGRQERTADYDQGVEAGIDKGYQAAGNRIRELEAVVEGKNTTIENMGKELERYSREQIRLVNENNRHRRELADVLAARDAEYKKLEGNFWDVARQRDAAQQASVSRGEELLKLRGEIVDLKAKLEELEKLKGALVGALISVSPAPNGIAANVGGTMLLKDMSAAAVLGLSRKLADHAAAMYEKADSEDFF